MVPVLFFWLLELVGEFVDQYGISLGLSGRNMGTYRLMCVCFRGEVGLESDRGGT